jgi:phenylpyruvate tautomerase PptA (4-oxalocrotonate tautomerase family)
MAQVKIFGLRRSLDEGRSAISQAIHESIMAAFEYPAEKKFHRFIALDEPDFIYPCDRSDRYTIIEISVFEGRSIAAKKRLIRLIYERIPQLAGIAPQDIELTIFETPRHAWGIRGKPGDEIGLNYTVAV